METAASTANTDARTVATAATVRLFMAATWRWRDLVVSNSATYHWSEKPGGGNFSARDVESDVITTTMTGPTRIATPSAATAPMAIE